MPVIMQEGSASSISGANPRVGYLDERVLVVFGAGIGIQPEGPGSGDSVKNPLMDVPFGSRRNCWITR
jgi:hypothetical protein